METYNINIKSHADAPDYEDTCEANSKEEASKVFENRIGRAGGDWSASDLERFIEEDGEEYLREKEELKEESQFSLENTTKIFNDINERIYGVRPFKK